VSLREVLRNSLSALFVMLGFFAPVLTFANDSLWAGNTAVLVIAGCLLGGFLLAGLVQRFL
jgi:hypothetical protein